VKKRKSAKKKDIKLNLSGVDFKDALRVMLRTPVPKKRKK
jgi:hypothetical protein